MAKKDMRVEKTSTGAIIYEPTLEVKQKALQYFSLPDPQREFFIYSGTDINRRPIFGKEHDVLYISSGFLQIKDPVIDQLRLSMTRVSARDGDPIHLEMNRTPRSQLQVDCIKKMTECKSSKLTIELKAGTGKSEPFSRKIPSPSSPSGWICMGDIKVGDYVFDRIGTRTKVLGVFDQGEQDIYKVTFQDGRVAYCTKEHLWTVRTHSASKWKTIELKDMMKDFKRINKWKVNHGRKDPYNYRYSIPSCQPVNYPKRATPIDPWVLGCFIGNGCCTKPYLTISSGNAFVPEEIARRCGLTCRKSNTTYNYYFYDAVTAKRIRTCDFFKSIPEMINCYSRDRTIPWNYIINDISTRLELLRGLMDTDGSISYNEGRYNVRYTSTSKKLLEQIQQLLYSFGYSGLVVQEKRKEEKYVNGYCGNITFRVPNSVKQLFFTLPEKKMIAMNAANQKQGDHYSSLLIKNIEYSHREQCRCILVDNSEHLYLTEDYIVTHNTFMTLASIAKIGKKPLIIAPTAMLKTQWIDEIVGLGIDASDIATRIYDGPNKKVCVVTISAIENELRKDWEGLMHVIDQANYGVRVVDEAHLHLKGNLKFDAINNIKRNFYLSATLGRSDESEDTILNRALLDADRFIGNKSYDEYKDEYINVYIQDIYYNASREICDKHFKFGKKGLISATYYRMLMDYRDGTAFYRNALHMLKIAEHIKVQGKVLLLLPLLDAIRNIREEMRKDPYFSKFSISCVDGSMKKDEKQKALEQDIILTTTMSCGTGVDISNLGAVVNFDQKSSLIILEQIVGRLRNRGFQTYYIDICDHVKYARAFENWGIKRKQYMPYFPGVSPKMSLLPKIIC